MGRLRSAGDRCAHSLWAARQRAIAASTGELGLATAFAGRQLIARFFIAGFADAYVMHGGTRCPFCDSENIEGGPVEVDAGTATQEGRVVANGGRVLNATGRGATLAEAQARAYALADAVDWPGGFYRRDIGWRAL